ncbi:hypothetical protein [Fusibacter ferrireducens]|uniref:DUF5673 domain-containing protein n=1 Tax=Fusibacter ferrireducens TaxID=2785058 RepID=A0ABR9ZQU1_9FIRM|nr:hypothetical protein [Fusibacter ferrireducens]MBF4691999.1 hypothetical protein [Fusibacter ferrireducens]
MRKVNLEILTIVSIVAIVFIISFLYISVFRFLSPTQIEFLKSDHTVAAILFLLNLYLLIKTIKSFKTRRKDTLEIVIKRDIVILILTLLMVVLTVIVFYLAYQKRSLALTSFGITVLLTIINGLMTHTSLSGISDTYIFHEGRRFPIENIESYDISSVYVYVTITKTFFFMNTFEVLRLSIEDNDIERFEQIMNAHDKHRAYNTGHDHT